MFFLSSIISLSSLSLWETAGYKLKYCLKGPFKPPKKQPSVCPCTHNFGNSCTQCRSGHIWVHAVFHFAGSLLQETGEAGSQTCDPLIGSLACYPLHLAAPHSDIWR